MMPMCSFGCDDLYERGYVAVENGRVMVNRTERTTAAVSEKLGEVVGRECPYWNDNSARYFEWHVKHHKGH